MESLIFAVLAGVMVTIQGSFNGIMTPYIGPMGTSLAGAVIQTVLLVVIQLIKEKKMVSLKGVPLIYYASGLVATVIVGVTGICVATMGSSVTTCCSVAGQIIMSAFCDHFGLFGNRKNRFSVKRIPGFVLILAGVLAMNLIGGSSSGKTPIYLLLIAMCLGAMAILVRSINYKVTKIVGSSIGGGIFNSVSGLIFSLILFFVMAGFKPDFSTFTQVPFYCYFAGLAGTACLMCNILAYRKEKIFYSTIFMLIGQVATGILMDIFVFHSLSVGKCIGIVIVLAGVLLDKILTRDKF